MTLQSTTVLGTLKTEQVIFALRSCNQRSVLNNLHGSGTFVKIHTHGAHFPLVDAEFFTKLRNYLLWSFEVFVACESV